jgi:uncharacterized protein (TIGR02680 family)
MRAKRWQLNRAGLFNFWYYDDEQFHFADGKLLLRGSNGSGKSVTMQSLIPVLLDGRKSPDRLDPFGSKARKMEDYLLGEKEIVNRDERTGYLYLEYKRTNAEQYLTTGIGLRAKRHSNMEFWGFVITDNRRIGYDVMLYKTEYSAEDGQEQKIPLTRRELETRLEQGGRVVRSQKEYMELVNKHIFGFESLDAYEELIKLLIQLRSPKLSKDFKPTVIYDILNASLPPLSDEELRPLSDTIENMDQIKQQLDQLYRDQASLERLIGHYDQYNRYVLAEKAEGLLKTVHKQVQIIQAKQKCTEEKEELGRQLKQAEEDVVRLNQEEEVLKSEEEELKQHDVFRAQKEKHAVEQRIGRIEDQIRNKEQILGQKRARERQIRSKIGHLESQIQDKEKEIYDHLAELDRAAEEAQFAAHSLSRKEFEGQYKETFDFTLWKNEAGEYARRLTDALQSFRRMQEAKERYEEAERELGELKKSLDLKRSEELKWQQLFEEEKEACLQAFHQWHHHNKVLKLHSEEVQRVAQTMMHWYDPYRIKEIKQPVDAAYNRHYRHWQDKAISLVNQLKRKEEELKTKEAELKLWKEKRDPEPERHPETEAFRSQLDERGIPYVPLYSVVEFYDHVSVETRERIESAMTQLGLLDALIVPEEYADLTVLSDRIIRPNPNLLAHTLADLLYPTPHPDIPVSASEIEDVLRSILVSNHKDGGTYLNEEGRYQIGLLEGHAPYAETSVFIGKESRRQYRLRMVAKLEKEWESLKAERDELLNHQKEVEQTLAILQEEYQTFPSDDQVDEAYDQWKVVLREVEALARQVQEKNEQVKSYLHRWQEIKQALKALTASLDLPLEQSIYETACREMGHYLNSLQELQLSYKDYANLAAQLKENRLYLEDLTADVDENQGELNILEAELNQLKLQLEQISARLKEMGAEEIQARIEEVQKRLSVIPGERERLVKEGARLEQELKHLSEEIDRLAQEERFIGELANAWQDVFLTDLNLKLVPVDAEEEKPLVLAKQVKKQYGSLLAKGDKDRESLTTELNKAYFQEQAVLVEYRLTQETIHEVRELPEAGDNEWFQQQVEQLKQTSRRIQLLMEYMGNRVTPYYVRDQIERDIDLQQSILTQKDRELYEEIIMNSVGRIIRTRINRSEQWVKQIDQLMSERDTSSGLTFSLRWKPRTADAEEEMDTKDLVDILRADPRLLKEEDIQRVTRHFRSKIERAKTLLEEKGYGETLHQAIKEILDYRQWFAFTLYYRREGEPKRELTNHVFYTFSGGEKAMAMYIPLFSAAYSRYLEARPDAPYIISLDEAFAGVDENNIRDMFALMEQLGFDYIINSQALWGDYDTVPSLSICELVRPKNAPFVTVVRYLWDGQVRQLLEKQEEMAVESG